MTTAIEELEKLASDVEDRVVVGLDKIAYDLRSLLPRLRTEERDGKREAFVDGVEWWGTAYKELKAKQAKAEALRRYPDKEA